jgi:hypothetical protein
MSKKKMTLEEIEAELNIMNFNLVKLCKLEYYDWSLEERMRYGRLYSMKERRLKELQNA